MYSKEHIEIGCDALNYLAGINIESFLCEHPMGFNPDNAIDKKEEEPTINELIAHLRDLDTNNKFRKCYDSEVIEEGIKRLDEINFNPCTNTGSQLYDFLE